MPDITPPAAPGLFNRSVVLAAANGTIVIPANHMIVGFVVFNSTANAITGGLKIGTTSGAVDVTVALAVGANAFVLGAPLKQVFSQPVDQTLFLQATTGWNNANITVTFLLANLGTVQ